MKVSRRHALRLSGTALTGLSIGLTHEQLLARRAPQQSPDPDSLVDAQPRTVSDLGLRRDGSAPEHPLGDREPISGAIWRYTNREPPQIDFDYRNLRVKIDGGRTTTRTGTMRFADLEPLPRREHVFLLQCGAPAPRGIVKWTGVRFSDVAEMLGVQSFARYARFVGSDPWRLDELFVKIQVHQQFLCALWKSAPICTDLHRRAASFRISAPSVAICSALLMTVS